MSAYLSNLLTTTTSKYDKLRRTLLSDEADGDTEDDTHICRVLRAYYQEKGKPYPQWLPPDPKAPQSAPAQFVSSSGRSPIPQQMGRGGGGLNDLWDTPQQQQQHEPASLRRAQGRGGGGRQPGRPGMNDSYSPEPQSQGRPLPSQRGGSYQSTLSGRGPESPPPVGAGSGASAQERLKARLWGTKSSTPAQSAGSSANSSPASTPGVQPGRSPYDRGGSGQSQRPPYPDDRSSGYSSNSGGGRQGSQPNAYNMSATSPWVGNDDPYGPGYNTGVYEAEKPKRPGGGRVGLPSGPRMR